MADVNLKDIVNTVTEVMTLIKSNETENIPRLATALPRDVDPLTGTAGWSANPQTMVASIVYPCAHPNPLCEDNRLRIGFRWTYDGSVDGAGQYIKDAEAFAIIDYINPTISIDAIVKFAESGTPIGDGPIAMITATVNVRVSQIIRGLLFTQFYGVRLLGDGSGDIATIG
jgi:hypothetical protein